MEMTVKISTALMIGGSVEWELGSVDGDVVPGVTPVGAVTVDAAA